MENNNIFNYSIKNTKKNKKSKNKLKKKSNINKIKSIIENKHNYKIKKYLGNDNNYHLFVVTNNNKNIKTKKQHKYQISQKQHKHHSNQKKYIIKVCDLNIENINLSKKDIKNQQYILNYLKSIPITKLYINNLYKLIDEGKYLFLILQYFDSLSLNQIKKYLIQLNNSNYQTFVQYIVKQILKGLKCIHHKNIPHGDINLDNILINHKMNKNVRIKFINFKINKNVLKKLKENVKKVKDDSSLFFSSNLSIKSSTKIESDKQKDIKDCGSLLKNIILTKYQKKIDLMNEKKQEDIKKKNKFNINNMVSTLFKKKDTIEDIIPEKLITYLDIIDELMIQKQTDLELVLKEILFYEKYKN